MDSTHCKVGIFEILTATSFLLLTMLTMCRVNAEQETTAQLLLGSESVPTLPPVTSGSPPTEQDDETFFSFPEFDYVESSKNEIAFKEWEAACTQTPACLGHQPLQKLRCIRRCISPSCYHEIYAFDELEDGEIDIRFQSFKGCFVQRLHKRRL